MGKNIQSWNVETLREQVAAMSDKGTLSEEVVQLLVKDGYAAPLEFEMLDFKETINPPTGIDRVTKAIVAIHNTFGGYLLFGVADARNGLGFPVVGVEPSSVDLERIKQNLSGNTEARILVAGCEVKVKSINDNDVSVILVHIPKRRKGSDIVVFKKSANPSNQRAKPEFVVGDIYYRNSDSVDKPLGSKVYWLSGARDNPYGQGVQRRALFTDKATSVQHNLPSREIICPKFVRRETLLDRLWAWLGDDLSHWRVIAGEGGLGKSSAAYEFSEQLLRYPEQPFDQILWLSAKKRQFDGLRDSYRRMPETHYQSFDEFVNTLCLRLGFREDEVVNCSQNDRRRMLREGLMLIPSFVVVDDVDSLTKDEQKKIGELVAWLSGNDSRFLITTRHNYIFSSASSEHLTGFERDEFDEFIGVLGEQIPYVLNLTVRQKDKLFTTTLGSPLLTESVCRQLKYSVFDDAITSWATGKTGELARAAVLRKEVEQLGLEAKRVLVAASMLSSASLVELSRVTDFPKSVVEAAIDELDSLFLVARPMIGGEPRFAVNSTTARLVVDDASSLVPDHKNLERRVKENNQEPNEDAGNVQKQKDSFVAAAIRQARAHFEEGEVEQAFRDLDDAYQRRKNPDLLSFKAKLLLASDPPRFDDARQAARDAYAAGCRHPSFFETWFQAEWALKQSTGALAAAEAAIRVNTPSKQEWQIKLSAAHSARSAEREATDLQGALKDLYASCVAMASAVKMSPVSERQQWLSKLFEMHDQLIELRKREKFTATLARVLLDDIAKMQIRGDTRRRLVWIAINVIDRTLKNRKGNSSVLSLVENADRIVKRRGSGEVAERDADLVAEWDRVRSQLELI